MHCSWNRTWAFFWQSCWFDITVSEQGVGFRFIRKAAEVNIKLLCNLQGYHHFNSQASAHVIAYRVCYLFISLWVFPITDMPVHHVWDWILSEYRLFTQWHFVRVQKGQRAVNLLGFSVLSYGYVMQFGWSLTFLCTPDICHRYNLVIKYHVATLIFNRLSGFCGRFFINTFAGPESSFPPLSVAGLGLCSWAQQQQ